MGMRAWGREHRDGSVGMGAWGRNFSDDLFSRHVFYVMIQND